MRGNLWEFPSDVLDFPREVGGEVISEWEEKGRIRPGGAGRWEGTMSSKPESSLW